MELGGVSAPVPFGGNVTERSAPELSAVLPLSLELDPESACVPIAGQELKLGVVTAMLGCPFFLWLILRGRARATS